jgi:hypothetical protein
MKSGFLDLLARLVPMYDEVMNPEDYLDLDSEPGRVAE